MDLKLLEIIFSIQSEVILNPSNSNQVYERQVSKNVLVSGVQKLSGASGVQKFPGVRCPKLFGSQVSGRQVSKS